MGARVLQWPHQGAKNSARVGLPDFRTTLSKFLGVRSRTAELEAWVPRTARAPTRKEVKRTMRDGTFGCGDENDEEKEGGNERETSQGMNPQG